MLSPRGVWQPLALRLQWYQDQLEHLREQSLPGPTSRKSDCTGLGWAPLLKSAYLTGARRGFLFWQGHLQSPL